MKNGIYWKLSAFFFVFFFGWLVFLAFMPIWFKQALNLTGTQIGIIFSANAALTMCMEPIYGYISDRIGMKKHLLYFIIALVIMTGPFFTMVYAPLLLNNFYMGVVAGGIYIATAYNAGIAAIESFIEKCGRKTGFEFGRSRMWGSLGAAVGIFCAGLAFNADMNSIFWIASGSALLLLPILRSVQIEFNSDDVGESKHVSMSDVKELFKIKDVWLFMTFIVGSACVYSVYDQQFAIYYASLFPTEAEGNEAFGFLNSFQVFLEAACMGLAPAIVNKLGPKRSLILAASIMTMRVAGSGIITNVYGISALKLLHAIELAILLVSVFKYIAKNFDNRLASVMYLVGFQLSQQLGATVLSPLAGSLYDSIGFSYTYLVLGAIVGTFTLFGAFVLVPDSKDVKKEIGE